MDKIKLKSTDSYVELKVVTAVLEEKLVNFKNHIDEKITYLEKSFSSKFNDVNKNFEKGSKRMQIIEHHCNTICPEIKQEITKLKRWKRDIVVGVSAIAAFVTFIINIIPWIWKNVMK